MNRTSGSFKEQLASVKKENAKRQSKNHQEFEGYRFFPNLPHPTKWEQDGVDHINISSMGCTELGPALYIGTRLKFTHAEFGEFHSLSNFWGYIETNAANERLRFLSTTARMEELKRHERHQVQYISFIILDAAWQRIQQLPPLLEAIKNSTLPFDNYFVGETSFLARWRRSISPWVVEGYELIREALKNGTQPDFSAFMGGKTREEIIDITIEAHGLRRARVQRVSNGFASNKLMAELNALTKGSAMPRRRQEIHNLRETKKDQKASPKEVAQANDDAVEQAPTIPTVHLSELIPSGNDAPMADSGVIVEEVVLAPFQPCTLETIEVKTTEDAYEESVEAVARLTEGTNGIEETAMQRAFAKAVVKA